MNPRLIKAALALLALLPAADLAYGYATGALLSPWRMIVQESGFWAMRFVTIGFAITPLRAITGWAWIAPLRRTLGHLAAFYTALHVFAWTRQYGFDWPFLIEETFSRPYLAIGVVATLLMLPLAATSFDAARRALGDARWQRVHRWVYPMAVLAWFHFMLSRGTPTREVYIHGIALGVLFAVRILTALRTKRGMVPGDLRRSQ
jgi:sulfoxide reductase heme-binding subunit YedZ